MGKIVHLVDRVNVRAGTLQAAFDDLAKGRSGLGGFDEWLTFDLAQPDGLARRKSVIIREDHDQRFCAHQPVDQVTCMRLRRACDSISGRSRVTGR